MVFISTTFVDLILYFLLITVKNSYTASKCVCFLRMSNDHHKKNGFVDVKFLVDQERFCRFLGCCRCGWSHLLPAEGQRRSSFHTGNPSDQNTHGEGWNHVFLAFHVKTCLNKCCCKLEEVDCELWAFLNLWLVDMIFHDFSFGTVCVRIVGAKVFNPIIQTIPTGKERETTPPPGKRNDLSKWSSTSGILVYNISL